MDEKKEAALCHDLANELVILGNAVEVFRSRFSSIISPISQRDRKLSGRVEVLMLYLQRLKHGLSDMAGTLHKREKLDENVRIALRCLCGANFVRPDAVDGRPFIGENERCLEKI